MTSYMVVDAFQFVIDEYLKHARILGMTSIYYIELTRRLFLRAPTGDYITQSSLYVRALTPGSFGDFRMVTKCKAYQIRAAIINNHQTEPTYQHLLVKGPFIHFDYVRNDESYYENNCLLSEVRFLFDTSERMQNYGRPFFCGGYKVRHNVVRGDHETVVFTLDDRMDVC